MVFASYGVNLEEDEIRAVCDSTSFGTGALNAVDAARLFGFPRSAKHTLSFDELADLIEDDKPVIVFVSLKPIDGVRETHAVVVIAMNNASVTVLDPVTGERTIAAHVFRAAWASRYNLAILVER
jgi:ABC-type bacteriocin/lantibiotic exporter with double-glycine peptidase domain